MKSSNYSSFYSIPGTLVSILFLYLIDLKIIRFYKDVMSSNNPSTSTIFKNPLFNTNPSFHVSPFLIFINVIVLIFSVIVLINILYNLKNKYSSGSSILITLSIILGLFLMSSYLFF